MGFTQKDIAKGDTVTATIIGKASLVMPDYVEFEMKDGIYRFALYSDILAVAKPEPKIGSVVENAYKERFVRTALGWQLLYPGGTLSTTVYSYYRLTSPKVILEGQG